MENNHAKTKKAEYGFALVPLPKLNFLEKYDYSQVRCDVCNDNPEFDNLEEFQHHSFNYARAFFDNQTTPFLIIFL